MEVSVVVKIHQMIQQKELGCVVRSVVSQTSNLHQVITLFSCSAELEHEISTVHKTKMLKNKDFLLSSSQRMYLSC